MAHREYLSSTKSLEVMSNFDAQCLPFSYWHHKAVKAQGAQFMSISVINHAVHYVFDGGGAYGGKYRIDHCTGRRLDLIRYDLATNDMFTGIGSSWRLSRHMHSDAGMWVTHKLPDNYWLLIRTGLANQVHAGLSIDAPS